MLLNIGSIDAKSLLKADRALGVLGIPRESSLEHIRTMAIELRRLAKARRELGELTLNEYSHQLAKIDWAKGDLLWELHRSEFLKSTSAPGLLVERYFTVLANPEEDPLAKIHGVRRRGEARTSGTDSFFREVTYQHAEIPFQADRTADTLSKTSGNFRELKKAFRTFLGKRYRSVGIAPEEIDRLIELEESEFLDIRRSAYWIFRDPLTEEIKLILRIYDGSAEFRGFKTSQSPSVGAPLDRAAPVPMELIYPEASPGTDQKLEIGFYAAEGLDSPLPILGRIAEMIMAGHGHYDGLGNPIVSERLKVLARAHGSQYLLFLSRRHPYQFRRSPTLPKGLPETALELSGQEYVDRFLRYSMKPPELISNH